MATKKDSKQGRFGPIEGVPVGSHFPSRLEVQRAGLHRYNQAGISGLAELGAEAIVVSGGYNDDVDRGDVIIYTGEGGREKDSKKHTKPQEFTKGNAALVRSEELRIPVRVIRGHKGDGPDVPRTGYRYDGLYMVESSWTATGRDGFLVWQFRMVKCSESTPVDVLQGVPLDVTVTLPDGNAAPGRVVRQASVIRRSALLVQKVKELHGYRCQVCGVVLETPSGPKAEGAHIQPLGGTFFGPDVPANLLCLCPNDHALFDALALRVGEDGMVMNVMSGVELGLLRLVASHAIDPAHLKHHRDRVDARLAGGGV